MTPKFEWAYIWSSQILVNTTKTYIFVLDMLELLCTEK